MKHTSKFLSYVLRHAPESIGIELDSQGWVSVDDLLRQAAKAGHTLSRGQLQEIVDTNEKKRFTLSEDGSRIRAAQGHSVAVDLGLESREPPAMLYHGTATRFLESITNEGLKPGSRQKVHLSLDEATAVMVGQRHGKPMVLKVDSARMYADGLEFWQAENGVWLTDTVPPQYLSAR